jgi:hypothetical protein
MDANKYQIDALRTESTPDFVKLSKGPTRCGLTDVLAQIKLRSRRIDEMDTKISELIGVIETSLRTHVNIRIEVSLNDHETLAFGKSNGQWRLLVITNTGEETPLASCPRATRVRVFSERNIDRLLADGIVQIDNNIKMREIALEKATELIAALS